jgi:hypothetical protein
MLSRRLSMADLVVIVPSRGRPEAADELARTFAETCTADTTLLFAIDDNDPTLAGYRGVVQFAQERQKVGYIALASRSMGEALAMAVDVILRPEAAEPSFALGFMGDDHRPRTKGWDQAYLDALREMGTGIVYGNDLLQGERIPTQVAMTSDIVRALGYMAPPALIHLYFDDFWKTLGTAAGCIRYLPDVVVEHMHPIAGKAEWDQGYARVNAPTMYDHDKAAFDVWRREQMAEDVAKVKTLRSVTA